MVRENEMVEGANERRRESWKEAREIVIKKNGELRKVRLLVRG